MEEILKTKNTKRTQAQRREQTQQLILDNAFQVFGDKGFSKTSLQDIATAAGITEGPIYHYFDNKINLFCAVTEHQEQILSDVLAKAAAAHKGQFPAAAWQAFLVSCKDARFCQVVLIDSLHVLGRERWNDTVVVKQVLHLIEDFDVLHWADFNADDKTLLTRMMIAALAEAALMMAENADYDPSPLLEKTLLLFFK